MVQKINRLGREVPDALVKIFGNEESIKSTAAKRVQLSLTSRFQSFHEATVARWKKCGSFGEIDLERVGNRPDGPIKVHFSKFWYI